MQRGLHALHDDADGDDDKGGGGDGDEPYDGEGAVTNTEVPARVWRGLAACVLQAPAHTSVSTAATATTQTAVRSSECGPAIPPM